MQYKNIFLNKLTIKMEETKSNNKKKKHFNICEKQIYINKNI